MPKAKPKDDPKLTVNEIVRREIEGIYRVFHGCALRPAELTMADKARGLKAGQLCDVCVADIDGHVRNILKTIGNNA